MDIITYQINGSTRGSLSVGFLELWFTMGKDKAGEKLGLRNKDNILARDKGDTDYLTHEGPRGAAGHT